jgi:plasmid stability protein
LNGRQEDNAMPTLTLKNVPVRIYRQIRSLAGADSRSLSDEAIALLDHALSGRRRCAEQAQVLAEIDRHRFNPSGKLPPAEILVREDRER